MVNELEVGLFWWCFVAYSVASAFHLVYLAVGRKPVARFAAAVMAAAFALQTAGLVLRSLHLRHLPLTNMYEYISMFSWFAALGYFVALALWRNHAIGAFVGPCIFMLIAVASLLPKQASMQLVPALQSWWLQIHVTLAALGEAAFLVAFACNVMYFVKTRLGTTRLAGRLPEAGALDRVGYKAVAVGYPLFTVGALFAGAIWAEQAWGSFWSWDPKEVGSLVVWLVYSAYLHARITRGWSGGKAAALSMIGFICTLLTFFANMVLGGLHAYG